MAKLYPPYIEGTIPAFYGNTMTIPFVMNSAVSVKDIEGFSVKIKTVQNSFFLANLTTSDYVIDTQNPYATFTVPDDVDMRIGQYYKIQLAYKSHGQIGYYSTVGVIKRTAKPEVIIDKMKLKESNHHLYNYIGLYHNNDNTEKVFSYQFNIYDSLNNLYLTSGEQLHNANNDDFDESNDRWYCGDDLIFNQSFYIEYCITTMNGAHVKSPQYRLIQRESISPEIQATLDAQLNYDEGYIGVNLKGILDDGGVERPITGAFVICRANVKTPNAWDEITRFTLQGELPSRKLFKDFTIQQGEKYIYSLQQYNDSGIYSARMLSQEVLANYEDAFLYDGQRQLKIKYNPEVSSFKNTIYETKTDTIGGKTPFIFRNSQVKYKEFPISGLISYYMDEAHLFMSEEEYNLQLKTADLTRENVNSERIFKLNVLEWLNDGRPKLFKSPTEGIYIVRLLNVTLSPNTTVGRMLHSFNCQAYEIAELNYENLNKYHLIQADIPYKDRLRWRTVELMSQDPQTGERKYITGELLRDARIPDEVHIAQTVQFMNMAPGDIVFINGQKIVIGATGSYTIDIQTPITSIVIPEHKAPNGLPVGVEGTVTYTYFSNYENVFDLIENVESYDVPAKQFMGESLKSFLLSSGQVIRLNQNIVSVLSNVKEKPSRFFVLNFKKRPVHELYYQGTLTIENNILLLINDNIYLDKNKNIILNDIHDLDPYAIYKLIDLNAVDAFNYYVDGNNGNIIEIDNYDTKFYMNIGLENNNPNAPIDFSKYDGYDLVDSLEYTVSNIGKVHDIYVGSGVMLTVAYLNQVLTYTFENEAEIQTAKQAYESADTYYRNELKNMNATVEDINAAREAANDFYNKYLNTIEIALQRYKEAHKID